MLFQRTARGAKLFNRHVFSGPADDDPRFAFFALLRWSYVEEREEPGHHYLNVYACLRDK